MTTMRLDSRKVLADTLPGGTVRDIALVAGSALFVGLSAQIVLPLPITPVPLSVQTFAVLLSVTALGATRGTAGMLVYLLAGMAGVPWFHQHDSGWSFPTFGYVVGFVLAALVVGTLAGRGADRTPTRTIGLMLAGNLTIYAVGVPWLMAYLHTNLTHALAVGVLPFLVADTLKIAAAAALLPATWHHINRR